MSSFTDEELFGRCFVGDGEPENLGRGSAAIRGASYNQGPAVIGNDKTFGNIAATLMVAPLKNGDSPDPSVLGSYCGVSPSNPSLFVVGNSIIKANLLYLQIFLQEEILLLLEM